LIRSQLERNRDLEVLADLPSKEVVELAVPRNCAALARGAVHVNGVATTFTE
jgi:hypothetical protein